MGVTGAERWLSALWPVVRERLPDPPARVVEVGCGTLGGFVPALRADGYDAVGVDPKAPPGPHYCSIGIEEFGPTGDVDAVVASTSLHHVADPQQVIAKLASALGPGGIAVVIEWAWDDLDEQTVLWGLDRLGSAERPGWLHRRRQEWTASGLPWERFLREWAEREHIHRAATLVQLLDERFERVHLGRGPYLFADLREASEEDEVEAIAVGEIRATRVDYVGRARPRL